MRLDPRLGPVEDRLDGQIVLQFVERLFDFGQLQVVAPLGRRVLRGQIRTQRIAAFPATGPAQPIAPQ